MFKEENVFHEVRSILASFYSCFKGNGGKFRFLFMTGITKFGIGGKFPELNHLRDISLSHQFATIAGFTFEELERYFIDHIKAAATQLDLTEQELIQKLILHYNGFCFERTGRAKVFTPWSILNFLHILKMDLLISGLKVEDTRPPF